MSKALGDSTFPRSLGATGLRAVTALFRADVSCRCRHYPAQHVAALRLEQRVHDGLSIARRRDPPRILQAVDPSL